MGSLFPSLFIKSNLCTNFFHSPYLNLLNIGYVLKISVGSTWPCEKKNKDLTFRSRFIIISFRMKITNYNYSLMSCPVSIKRSIFTLNPALQQCLSSLLHLQIPQYHEQNLLMWMRFFKPITCSVMPPATISATATPVTCPSAKTATSDPSVFVSAVCSSLKPAFCPSTPTTVTFTSSVIPAFSLQRSAKSSAHSAVQESLVHKLEQTRERLKTALKRISSLEKENASLRIELESTAERLEAQNEITKSSVYKSNCRLKKKNQHLTSISSDLKKQAKQYEKELAHSKHEKLLLQKKSHLKLTNKRLRDEKSNLNELAIKATISDTRHAITTREKLCNRFSDSTRLTVLALQEAGVAASKCSTVVDAVSRNLFGQKSDLPSASTAENISDEAHVLSKVHATEKVLNSSGVTLHTVGTSRKKRQYIGQQITLSNGSLINLGFSEVATEDSETLLATTINLLDELSDLYCHVSPQEKDQVFKSRLEKINSLMSDRAAVMQCYNKKINVYKRTALQTDTHTHTFFIPMHISCLAFPVHVRQHFEMLKRTFCSSNSSPLGRDSAPQFKNWGSSESATARLIRTSADVLGPRGDEKSGYRHEWLAYCKKQETKSDITSYRQNIQFAF